MPQEIERKFLVQDDWRTESHRQTRIVQGYLSSVPGRSVLVRRAKPLLLECVVREYLSGSGWKDYTATGSVCGYRLPPGMTESSNLSKLGRFIAMTLSAFVTIGEAMGSSETTTQQFAVPPLISGP